MKRAIILLFAGCGISEQGLLDVDGGVVDANLPETCSTLDAACLGALGAAWTPIALTDAGCASGFTAQTFETNPRLLDGGCACGACQVTGSFGCMPSSVAGGNKCDDPPLAQAASGQCTQAHAQHLEAYPSQATPGTIGCSVANDAGAGAMGDNVTTCIPTSCAADFCGGGGSVCAIAEGDVPCPTGLTLLAHVGTGVDPNCAPCACDASAPGTCSGSVTGFETTNCTDGGLVHTYDVGTCNVFDNNIDYSSVIVTLVPPDASCSSVSSGAIGGDAGLVGTKTICCK